MLEKRSSVTKARWAKMAPGMVLAAHSSWLATAKSYGLLCAGEGDRQSVREEDC